MLELIAVRGGRLPPSEGRGRRFESFRVRQFPRHSRYLNGRVATERDANRHAKLTRQGHGMFAGRSA